MSADEEKIQISEELVNRLKKYVFVLFDLHQINILFSIMSF